MGRQLSDQQIYSVIAALRRVQQKVTGSEVREELRRRHGSPGGVARVYRLMQQPVSMDVVQDDQAPVAETTLLRAQLAEALQRAVRAEQREEIHQARWAGEIDALRRQLRDAQVERRLVSQLQDQVLALHRRIRQLSDPTMDSPTR